MNKAARRELPMYAERGLFSALEDSEATTILRALRRRERLAGL